MRKNKKSQTCKVCHQEFAPDHPFVIKSKRCPSCGTPFTPEKAQHTFEVAFAVVLVCVVVVVFVWVAL